MKGVSSPPTKLSDTAPVTQAYADAAAAGSATEASRRDHRHGMPAQSGMWEFVETLTAAALTTISSNTLPTTSSVFRLVFDGFMLSGSAVLGLRFNATAAGYSTVVLTHGTAALSVHGTTTGIIVWDATGSGSLIGSLDFERVDPSASWHIARMMLGLADTGAVGITGYVPLAANITTFTLLRLAGTGEFTGKIHLYRLLKD